MSSSRDGGITAGDGALVDGPVHTDLCLLEGASFDSIMTFIKRKKRFYSTPSLCFVSSLYPVPRPAHPPPFFSRPRAPSGLCFLPPRALEVAKHNQLTAFAYGALACSPSVRWHGGSFRVITRTKHFIVRGVCSCLTVLQTSLFAEERLV